MSTHSSEATTFTIREAAKLTGLPESTLRYYETIGIINPIARDDSGYRTYSQSDIDAIDIIACLNATGMPVDSMRAYTKNMDGGAAKADVQIRLFQKQQKKLQDEAEFLKLRQQYTDAKIEYWRAVGAGDTVQVASVVAKTKLLMKALKLPNTQEK